MITRHIATALATSAFILATLPVSAYAQAYSPMPPACQASSDAAQAAGNRYPAPPANAPVIAQMQHILWAVGLLMDSLDESCRDWADYSRTRAQFENQYNSTMRTCREIAVDHGDCRRQPYGG